MSKLTARLNICLLAVAMLLVIASAVPALAQSTVDGAIGGVISDATGAVIVGANVTARNQGTNQTVTATADSAGGFRVTHLQPGTYSVSVSAGSFAPFKADGVIVEVGRITRLDVKLTVGGTAETISVTGEAPVIDTARADVSLNINETSMNDLPISFRRWSTFALGTPGATADGFFGLVAFRGISGLLNNNTVDGGDNNNAYFSEERGRTRISSTVGQGSIREFQVNTSNFSAEYGRAAGAVVNAVTKSGTNSLHGSGFTFVTDSDMWAFNPFAFQTTIVNGVKTQTPLKPPDRRWQFGGNIGGPIKKDKIFFFFNWDQQKENAPGVATPDPAFLVPITVAAPPSCTASGLSGGGLLFCRGVTQAQSDAAFGFLASLTGQVPRNKDQYILFPKVDFHLSDKHTLSTSWNHMRWNSLHGIQTAATVNRGIASWGDDFVNVDTVNSRLTSMLTNMLTNEFRVSIGREDQFENSNPPAPGEPTTGPGGRPPSVAVSRTGAGSFSFGKPNFLERKHNPLEFRFQFTDVMTATVGKHLLKWGFDFNRSRDTVDFLFNEGGSYSYSNIEDFISDFTKPSGLCSSGSSKVPCYNSYSQGVGPTAFEFRTIDYAGFLQDEWHVLRRLTLNLGGRYEYEAFPNPLFPNPNLLQSQQAKPKDHSNFGPRIGAALDLTGDGKTVLRGGYGVYYGRVTNQYIGNILTVTGAANSQLSTGNLKPCVAGSTGCTAPIYPNVLTTAGASSSPPGVNVWGIIKNPRIHEADVVLEREIARNTVVSVSYLMSLGRRLPEVNDINLAPSTQTITYTVSGGPDNGKQFTFPLYTARLNAGFNNMSSLDYVGRSRYDGIVFQLNRRMANGLQVQTSYTHGRATDTNQHTDSTIGTVFDAIDPYNRSLDNGTSGFDIRHKFAVAAVWQPQVKRFGGIVSALVNGFSIAPIISIGSGAPLTLFASGTAPTVCRTNTSTTSCPTADQIKPISTGINGAGTGGRLPNLARNSFRTSTIAFGNLRIARRFRVTEGKAVELIAECFNCSNHLNPTSTNSQLYTIGSLVDPVTKRTIGGTLTYNAFDPVKNTGLGAIQNGNNQERVGLGVRQFQVGARFSF